MVSNLGEAEAALKAERDENTCRKEFTKKEATLLGMQLEKLLAPKAIERHREGSSKGGSKQGEVTFTSPPKPKQTRDVAAEAGGMSGPTYTKAKEVLLSGDKDLIAQLNNPKAKVASVHEGHVSTSQRRQVSKPVTSSQTF